MANKTYIIDDFSWQIYTSKLYMRLRDDNREINCQYHGEDCGNYKMQFLGTTVLSFSNLSLTCQ